MHLKERAAWGYGPQPAETLLEGEEIAEIIAAAHGLPVVRLTPGESARRDGIGGGTVLGKGRLEELAAITGGTGVVGSMAIPQKSKARERFEDADEKKPDAPQIEPDPEAPPKPEFVIVDHEISPSQARNLERATGAQVLD